MRAKDCGARIRLVLEMQEFAKMNEEFKKTLAITTNLEKIKLILRNYIGKCSKYNITFKNILNEIEEFDDLMSR